MVMSVRVSSIGKSGLSASRRCGLSNAGPIEQNKGVVRSMYAYLGDSVKAVQKHESPFPLQPLPVWGGGGGWSDSTPSTPTPDLIGFGQTIKLNRSAPDRDSPIQS